ncbi:MAG: hypothetical protein JSS32_07140 [Verrucomicrobia bacterium]|nr:hypothetical protein [Verrucomicrobiota bacterium]
MASNVSSFTNVRANVALGFNQMATKLATKYAQWTKIDPQDLNTEIPRIAYNVKVGIYNMAVIAAVAFFALGIFTAISFLAGLVVGGLFLLLAYAINKDLKEVDMEKQSPTMQAVTNIYNNVDEGTPEVEVLRAAGIVPKEFKENSFELLGLPLWKNFARKPGADASQSERASSVSHGSSGSGAARTRRQD